MTGKAEVVQVEDGDVARRVAGDVGSLAEVGAVGPRESGAVFGKVEGVVEGGESVAFRGRVGVGVAGERRGGAVGERGGAVGERKEGEKEEENARVVAEHVVLTLSWGFIA